MSRVVCALALSGFLASSTRAEAPAPATAPAAGVTEIAARWRALKRGNVKLLAKVTRYPFRLAFQNAPCTCDDGDAHDSAQLAEITRALMQDSEIKGQTFDPAETAEIARDEVPSWAALEAQAGQGGEARPRLGRRPYDLHARISSASFLPSRSKSASSIFSTVQPAGTNSAALDPCATTLGYFTGGGSPSSARAPSAISKQRRPGLIWCRRSFWRR